jgi:hypothetical protein
VLKEERERGNLGGLDDIADGTGGRIDDRIAH